MIPGHYRGREQAFVKHTLLKGYIEKLFMIADFMALGSRQTRTGRPTMSIIRFMTGSVIRKCFWL